MKQAEIFRNGEGREWLKRNIKKIGKGPDPVLEAIQDYKIAPKAALEIGCANGWRLDALEEKYSCFIRGLDPHAGKHPAVMAGTADYLPWTDQGFDLIIYGWCLYLCDPEDYFTIVAEADRVLENEGYIVIYDFCTDRPYKVPYKHKEGVFSYHYDFSQLWLAHPHYKLYGRTVQDETCVTIIRKNIQKAFPEER